jgi:cell division protein FtsB
MVIRQRFRAIFFPLLLYGLSSAAVSYFLWHANNGERGLKTNDEFARKIAELDQNLQTLKAEHEFWDHKIGLLKSEIIDRDLLDEEARYRLGRAAKNDLIIFLPPLSKNSAPRSDPK